MQLEFPSLPPCHEIALFGFVSLCLVLVNGYPDQAAARPALVDNLDRPTLAFRLKQQSSEVKLIEHGQVTGLAQFGLKTERVRLQSPVSNSAMLSYQIPKAPAIGELRMSFVVMSSCPGVRLAANVTLPRTNNPATSTSYQVMVTGTSTTQVGVWQHITLDRLPERLARQARVARLQTNNPLDERGAYVQELLLIVPGTGKPEELLVDRVEVEGVLQTTQDNSDRQPSPGFASQRAPIDFVNSPGRAGTLGSSNADQSIQSNHSVIQEPAHELPQVPRIIQWQGESFDSLAKLDFDAIAMKRPATLQEMADARALGLFLVCPPPTPDEIRAGKITDAYSSVMAWDLGSLVTTHDLKSATFIKGLLTRHDPDIGRLTIIRPNQYVHEASRIANVVLIGRDTLAADLSLNDYATWLTGRKRLARPGTPIWIQIDTELPPGASTQQTMLATTGKYAAVTSQQRLATQVALAATLKSQGFYFTSHTSLTAKNVVARNRALAMELTNLRIGLIKPWLASGKLLSTARSNSRQLTATVLQVERSYLLVPIHWQPEIATSHEPRFRSQEQTTFLVPGVPESCEVYFLTPAGASTIRHRRVTGGIRIMFDSHVPDGFVLFTEDGHAFSGVARYIQRHSNRTTQRTRDLASNRLQRILPQVGALTSPGTTNIRPLIHSTQVLIGQCDALLAQRNIEVAYQRAVAANTMMDQLEIAFAPTAGHPTSWSTSTGAYAPKIPEANAPKILEANFENLTELQQTGWRHHRLLTVGLESAVRLSPEEPYQGSYCLELEVQPAGPAPLVVATAPVWVSSPPVPVHVGEKVEVRGMVRVSNKLVGSVDGLQIIDSLGGMPLALRIQQTNSWKPFRIVRTIPADTELTLTFALTGLGKAQIDAVTVSRLPNASSLSARQPSKSPSSAR
ncbi:MAG: hypothetical protein ABGX16_19800 [Pirellulales bacterium]